jgi:hypothetical protein
MLIVVFGDRNIFTPVHFKGLNQSSLIKKQTFICPSSLNSSAQEFLKPSVKMLPNFKTLLFAEVDPIISL